MIAFKVYPRRHDKRHFRVIVFDSTKQMHGYQEVSVNRGRSRMPPTRLKRDYAGIACYRDHMAFGKRLDCRGEIHITRQAGAGTVAHEMTHAASYFLRWDCRMKPGSRSWEEAMATAVGELTRQCWICRYRDPREKRA